VHPLHLPGVTLIGEEGRVEVAVAKVAKGGHLQPVLFRGLRDEGDHASELAARHGGILEDRGRPQAGECGEGTAPRLAEPGGLRAVRRRAHLEGSLPPGDPLHGLGLLCDGRGMAIRLHEEEGLGGGGQADPRVLLHALQGFAVEKLEGTGNDRFGDDRRHRGGGRLHGVVGGEEGPLGRRRGNQLEEHFRDHAEGPLAPDVEVAQAVAGDILHALVAEPENFALGADHFQPHHVVPGDPVFEPAQTTGVVGDIPADRGNFLRAGIRRVEEAVGGGLPVDGLGEDAGLGEEGEVPPVEFEDPVHASGAEDDRILHGHTSPGEPGATSPGDHGSAGAVGLAENRGDFLRTLRKPHRQRPLPEAGGAIEAVGEQVLRGSPPPLGGELHGEWGEGSGHGLCRVRGRRDG